MELTLLGALAAGFFGSTHCLGMCGGIAASLGLQTSGAHRLFLLVLYQLGRPRHRQAASALVVVFAVLTAAAPFIGLFGGHEHHHAWTRMSVTDMSA